MPVLAPEFDWPVDAVPAIRVAGRFLHRDRGFSVTYRGPWHALHLYDYDATIRFAGRDHTLRPGDYTITPGGHRSQYDLPDAGYHWCIHFEPIEPWPGGASLRIPWVGRVRQGDELSADHFAMIAALASDRSVASRRRAQLRLQDLLLGLAVEDQASEASMPRVGRSPHPAVQRAGKMLLRHLSEPLDVPRLARDVGLSQNYLAKLFREHYGQTLQRYQLQHRINRADVLLRTTDMPIKAIGAHVGLPDAQHFRKAFHTIMGQSPSSRRNE